MCLERMVDFDNLLQWCLWKITPAAWLRFGETHPAATTSVAESGHPPGTVNTEQDQASPCLPLPLETGDLKVVISSGLWRQCQGTR